MSLAVCLAACGGNNAGTATSNNNGIAAQQQSLTNKASITGEKVALVADSVAAAPSKAAEIKEPKDMLGFYVGMFGDNKINICLTSLGDSNKVSGYSVVAGNDRKFKGKYFEDKAKKTFRFEVKEDGTDKYDGYFVFKIDPKNADSLGNLTVKGDWTPFDKKMKGKKYDLVKRQFKYDPSVGLYPEGSNKLLTEAEVENMMKTDLRMMRNAIYARHGYSFKMKDMRTYFDEKDWYMPMHTDIRSNLTDIEMKNSELIKRYEKYASDYYDGFGR
jgi:hypothetical protein